jgi:two-component system, NarL family, nitrate/nitrite response regulator NarL
VQHVMFLTNQPVLAIGIELILKPDGEFKPTIVLEDDPNALSILTFAQAGIVVIDFAPEDNFPLLFRLRRELPEFRIVIWSRKISPEAVYQLVNIGVKGVFLSSSRPGTFLECIRTVASGGTWFDKELNTSLVDFRTAALSPREAQLVIMVSQGLKNKEIADALGLSNCTVRMYMSALFRKLGVKDRYELAIYGARHLLGSHEQGARSSGADMAEAGNMRLMILERPNYIPSREPQRAGPRRVSFRATSTKRA